MKYVNNMTTLIMLLAALSLSGCSTTVTTPELKLVIDLSKPAPLLNTAVYIPVRVSDEKTGELLPYEKTLNPYAQLKGKIAADTIKTFVQARNAFQAGNMDQATTLLNTLIQEEQTLSGPRVLLGDIATRQRSMDQAVAHYLKAININPVNVNAYLKLAKALRIQGHFTQAQNTYAKALSVWPDCAVAHLNLAILYDIYLNMPLKAQRHLESYQFLTHARDDQGAQWLAELQQRTGAAIVLETPVIKAVSTTSSQM